MNRHIYPQTQNQYLLLFFFFLSLADQLLYIESVSGDDQIKTHRYVFRPCVAKLVLMLCLLEDPDVL